MEIRTEYYENTLCVEGGWLYESGVISKPNYDKLLRKNVLNVIRRGCRNTPSLVSWMSIPERFKKVIIERFGNPKKLTPETHFTRHIQQDKEAIRYFSTFQLPNGRTLELPTQKEYYWNAVILNTIQYIFNDKKVLRKMLGGSTLGIWGAIAETVEKLDKIEYPHSLPAHERRLKEKYNRYLKDGYYSLIHGAFCNHNARVVDAKLERLILSIYCMSNKPYSSWVHEDYLQFIAGVLDIVDMESGELFDREDFFNEKKGTYTTISEATCWNYINNPKNRAIVDAIRSNHNRYVGNIRPHYHRHAPHFSLSKISLDDRDLPRRLHDGNRVKAYYAYDVASGVLLGSAYSLKKDANLFIDCIRDMFRFIDRNGWGMPLEMEVEHHLVSLFKDDLMKAGVVFPFVRWCAPSNSQEKHAEQFNRQKKYGYEKRYQDGIGRFYAKGEANQTGGERIYNEQNNKYEIKEKTYSIEELIADDRAMIDAYNNGLHRNQKLYKNKTRLQVMHENINPNLADINRAVLVRYIGNCTTTSIQRNMYCQVQYTDYMLPSPEILSRLAPNNYTVQAYYLPGKINEVYVYQNDNFIAECKKIKTFNTSTAETTESDKIAMSEQAKYIAAFDAMIKRGKADLAKAKFIPNIEQYDSVETEVVATTYDDEPAEPVYEFADDDNYYAAKALADF